MNDRTHQRGVCAQRVKGSETRWRSVDLTNPPWPEGSDPRTPPTTTRLTRTSPSVKPGCHHQSFILHWWRELSKRRKLDAVPLPNTVIPGCEKAQGWLHPHEGVQLVADIMLKGSSPWFNNGGVLALRSGGRDQLLATCHLGYFIWETRVDSPFVFLPLVVIGVIMQESRSWNKRIRDVNIRAGKPNCRINMELPIEKGRLFACKLKSVGQLLCCPHDDLRFWRHWSLSPSPKWSPIY